MKNENKESVEGEVIPFRPETALAVFTPFQKQLADLKVLVESSHFNYADQKQNEEARSLIYKVRKVKAAVEKARKDAKQSALDYGRALDGKAKEIASEIEIIIDVHQKPIDEIERRENARKAAHNEKLEFLREHADIPNRGLGETSGQIQAIIDSVAAFKVDKKLEEFEKEGAQLKAYALSELQKYFNAVKKTEDEAAELERLRKEKEERDRKDREDRIAKEAAERATQEAEEKAMREKAEAEAKAKAEKEASDLREREAKEAAERAVKSKQEAEERAAKAEQQAKENAEREQREKQEDERREAETREANQKHKAKINNEAASALVEEGLSKADAKLVVTAIALRKVPHIKIEY